MIINDVCFTWMKKIVTMEKPSIESTFANLRNGALDHLRKESYDLFLKTISLDYHTSGPVISQFVSEINAYLEENLTKRQLTTSVDGLALTKALHDIHDAAAAKTPFLTEFKRKVDALNLIVTEGFGNLIGLNLPILNKVNVHDLSFIKAVQDLDRKEFNDMIKSFDDDFHEPFH